MYIFENKFIRFLLMVILWCAGFLPGLLVLKNDSVLGSYHILHIFWGIALLGYMIFFTLLDEESSGNYRWLMGLFILGTGVLGSISGGIAVYQFYNNGLRHGVNWMAQMITFSSLMLISYMLISKMTDVGHSIYQIICTALSFIALAFGTFSPTWIIIFIIAGYLGFLGLRYGY